MLLSSFRNTNPECRAAYKHIPIEWSDMVREELAKQKRQGQLAGVLKIRYRFRGPRVHNDRHTLKREAKTFTVYFDYQAPPTFAAAAAHRSYNTPQPSIQTIVKARLTTPEYALYEAGRQREDRRANAVYESLQEVMEVRDTLLKHVYRLLNRPNGILLRDMSTAVSEHQNEVSKLHAENRRLAAALKTSVRQRFETEDQSETVRELQERNTNLAKKNEVLTRENHTLRQDATHDHKIVGDLYGELGDLYKRLAVQRYEER